MNALREWFNALASRERILVSVAAVLSVVALLVIGLFRPLATGHTAAAEALVDKRAVLSDIERVASRFGPNAAAAAAASQPGDESLVVLIDRTTRSNGIGAYLKRNEPDGNANIRLRFENAPFDELMGWLIELQTVHAISVTSATTDPAQETGRVNANLQLGRTALPKS